MLLIILVCVNIFISLISLAIRVILSRRRIKRFFRFNKFKFSKDTRTKRLKFSDNYRNQLRNKIEAIDTDKFTVNNEIYSIKELLGKNF